MKTIVFLALLSAAFAADFETYCRPVKDPGPCKGYFPRWWFNVQSGQCEQFVYGGCQGNKNNYETMQQCEQTCLRTRHATEISAETTDEVAAPRRQVGPTLNARVDPVCRLKADRGLCLGYFPRYYYNSTLRTCEEFIYGGCQGNENNFVTVQECEQRCKYSKAVLAREEEVVGFELKAPADFETYCKPEKYPGPCKGYFPRWWFDVKTGQCEQFIYGGCQGNKNNYETKEECELKCLRTAHGLETSGDISAVWTEVPRVTAGLDPVCKLRADPGPCLAYFPRYYFNSTLMSCQKFIYGGCQGNANNFQTLQECQQRCKRPSEISAIAEGTLYETDVPENTACLPKPEAGPCEAYMPRYYFDKSTKTCKEFIYGGCDGNRNNFKTPEECEASCAPTNDYQRECLARPETGPCRAHMPMWAFDITQGQCVQFVYGGCDGTDNKYRTKLECEKNCNRPQNSTLQLLLEEAGLASRVSTSGLPLSPVCYLPKVVGRCLAYMPRYYYNTTTRTCEKFIYGGCGGNANNFFTFLECNQTCPSDVVFSAIAEPELATSPLVENFACNDKPDPGMCAGYFPRYYFDKVTNTCKQFVYGGCGGNRNNYNTAHECMASCAPTTDYERKCLARAETGPCRAHVLLWAYDSTEGHCKQFTYGGCDGNDNKYPTKEDCESTCLRPEGKNVCC
ncbi:papilin-like [Haemaphysalis longicornis]